MKTKLEVSDRRFIQGQGDIGVTITWQAGMLWRQGDVAVVVHRFPNHIFQGNLSQWNEIGALVNEVAQAAKTEGQRP